MEEDHYRLQCIKSGFQVDAALKGCQELERMLGEKGTLMRLTKSLASDRLPHQPWDRASNRRYDALKGLAVTGALRASFPLWGSLASRRGGCMARDGIKSGSYQISNQTTLGISEEDIAKNLSAVVREILKKEREAREMLMRKMSFGLKIASCAPMDC